MSPVAMHGPKFEFFKRLSWLNVCLTAYTAPAIKWARNKIFIDSDLDIQ